MTYCSPLRASSSASFVGVAVPPFWRGAWLQIGPELLLGVSIDQVQGVELFSVAERVMFWTGCVNVPEPIDIPPLRYVGEFPVFGCDVQVQDETDLVLAFGRHVAVGSAHAGAEPAWCGLRKPRHE